MKVAPRPLAARFYPWLLLLASDGASAHSFGQTYTLPVPVWLYLYGATAALVVSFVVVGFFVNASPTQASLRSRETSSRWCPSPALLALLRSLSVSLLLLAVVAGFLGTQRAYHNINMTLFWVVFGLGFTYLSALIGDWFSVLNPFRVIIEWLERLQPTLFNGHWRYPGKLSYWPALVLYMGFIWLELFGRSSPFSLSVALSAYLMINLAGCWLVGKANWLEHCEFLGVFLRLVARIAPIRVEVKHPGSVAVSLRRPFSGLFQQNPVPFSLLVFVLFMLSSTAFDGLHETALWVGAFWENLYQWVLIPMYGNAPPVTYLTITKILLGYQSVVLLVSPFIYLAIYALFILTAKKISGSALPVKELLAWFALSLIPIAFAYHFTHYYTLLQVQGPQIIRLLSDPLGIGWDIVGTARTPINIIPDMSWVWHTQVFVIVAGHVVSVYLSHMQALKVFANRKTAALSQLPLLILMVGLTTAGLWILSLPHKSGGVAG